MADTPVFTATVAAVNRPPRPPKPVQLDMLHQLLMTPGVDVDLPGGWHHDTPLCTAVKEGCLFVVNMLLARGADSNKQCGTFKETAMHKAVYAYCTFEDKRSIIFELLAHNVDINAPTREGLTALHMACRNGDIHLLMLLLQLGANIHAITTKGQTALMCAVWNKYEPEDAATIVRLLVEYDADVLAVDSNNRTLLHTMVACETMDNLPLALFLIENGVQDDVDRGGVTAGDLAINDHPHVGVKFAEEIQRMFAEHRTRLLAFATGNRERGRHASLVIRGAHDWAPRSRQFR